MLRSLLVVRVLAVLATLSPGPSARAADTADIRWTLESWGRGGEPPRAIAVDESRGTLAVGSARGVWLVGEGGVVQSAGATAAVTGLSFDRHHALWIATEAGLWRRAPGSAQPLVDVSPAPGEAARRVHRFARAGGVLAVATDAGVFVAREGGAWQRVAGAGAPARTVALQCDAAGRCDLWWLAAAALWHARLGFEAAGEPQRRDAGRPQGAASVRIEAVAQQPIAGAPTGALPVDLLVGTALGEIVVAYPRSLAVRSAVAVAAAEDRREGPPRIDVALLRSARPPAFSARRAGEWTLWRPVMPPGAVAHRLVQALGAFWLATDRGLLRADDPRLGWLRASPPAGAVAVSDVASAGGVLWVASGRGILRGTAVARPTQRLERVAGEPGGGEPWGREREARFATAPGELGIGRVQSLALRHLGLGPGRSRRLRERAARRSWWPEVELEVGYGGDRARRLDFDQTYSSGATHQLFDRDASRGDDWDAALELRWDLAAAVFDPEIIDLAREERAWIALRDDVLDEINQLYFERRRVLLDLAALPPEASTEAARLRLRVRELAAGLDAWTGGGFSRARTGIHPGPEQE